MEEELKKVKVDNWGIFFLQRLKHFFNRTDFCDLTLQFQDKAQLKVHRLVLSACTEYFEVLERTCEMYEDCLVMPDDLQADVVVPIVNFMYTGHLEFESEALEKLYLTSQVMNLPVLTKLLNDHRQPTQKSSQLPKSYSKSSYNHNKLSSSPAPSSSSYPIKRSYSKAFENNVSNKITAPVPSTFKQKTTTYTAHKSKINVTDPKPTRYEIPEELESEIDESFTNISYESKPLMIHLGYNKKSPAKRSKTMGISNAKEMLHGTSTVKIIDNIRSKKLLENCSIFDEDSPALDDKIDFFQTTITNVTNIPQRSTGHLFDQILDNPIDEPMDIAKVTLEADDAKQPSNLDHAKIISEVLKKYPHLVKSNKNLKLKILNTGKTTKVPVQQSKVQKSEQLPIEFEPKLEKPDYVETDILDSQKAAKLISMGAMNIKGPWVCLICGTPEKAILFKSYYTFRRHLVEVHNEKPLMKICEYCGTNTPKRNYLFHHLLTKHGIKPPPSYNFPKCNVCNYIGLNEALLVKHKVSHSEYKNFKCYVCADSFANSAALLLHIQKTGHKYTSEKKNDLQCIYCLRVFTRKANLYAHIKTNHKQLAKLDGIIDDSDEERQDVVVKTEPKQNSVLYEYSLNFEQSLENTTEKQQKILNSEFSPTQPTKTIHKPKLVKQILNKQPETIQNEYSVEVPEDNLVVTIDGEEYMVKNNQFIQQPKSTENQEYVLSNYTLPIETAPNSSVQTPSTSTEFENKNETRYVETVPDKVTKKTSRHIEQPIQIVVSNDEEYKALMSTNHSIIFNDVDNNKTLTVLTTAQNSELNNTIDMEVAQSNEMMILPGNYPLSNVVSNSVTSNNSNIVVVYTHPQEGSAQFVETAMHYETISPSTGIINSTVMQQDPESWQSEIQDESGLQTVNNPVSFMNQNNIVQDQELADLPDVQLTEISQTYTQEVILSQNYSDEGEHIDTNSATVQEINENIVEEEVCSIPTIPMEVVIPADLQSVQECTTMPQIEENLISPCADDQGVHSIHIEEIETSTNIEDANQKNKPIVHQNNIELQENNINELHGVADQLDNDQENVDINVVCNNNLQTVQGSQIACPSNDTNEVCNIVSKEQLDIVVDPNVEAPSESHEVLQHSEIIEETSEELAQELIQATQCENSAQKLLNSMEVSKSTEIRSNVIILSNDLVNVHTEVTTSQLIEDIAVNVHDEFKNKDFTDNHVQMVETLPNTENIPEVVKEQIQSITSEWSEEELETTEPQVELNENEAEIDRLEKSTLSVNDISNISMAVNDVEESIENIQQEMEKQMAETESEPVQSINSKSQEEVEIHVESEHVIKRNAQPEQISSLLNDWEDNEEPKEEVNTSKDLVTIENEQTMAESAPVPPEVQGNPSNDNIQSLVSDWDDEEEKI